MPVIVVLVRTHVVCRTYLIRRSQILQRSRWIVKKLGFVLESSRTISSFEREEDKNTDNSYDHAGRDDRDDLDLLNSFTAAFVP